MGVGRGFEPWRIGLTNCAVLHAPHTQVGTNNFMPFIARLLSGDSFLLGRMIYLHETTVERR